MSSKMSFLSKWVILQISTGERVSLKRCQGGHDSEAIDAKELSEFSIWHSCPSFFSWPNDMQVEVIEGGDPEQVNLILGSFEIKF